MKFKKNPPFDSFNCGGGGGTLDQNGSFYFLYQSNN
jgi:hypothetical protein